jgi:hypothetical protein
MSIPALRRLVLVVQAPPPWFWLGKGWIWRRCRAAPLSLLPLELVQQLHWWLIRPLRLPHRRSKGVPLLPWKLTLRACWLNSYRPIEVAWWWALGIRSWNQLTEQTPDSMATAVHAKRRRHWPDQCRPALQLLADKAALLACTPERWRAPFSLLHPQQSTHQPHDIVEVHPEMPNWWWEALRAEGVVLKPQRGHAGRGVIRFRWSGSALEQQALFRRLPADAPHAAEAEPPTPAQLLAHWHRLCRSDEPALAAPYLCHSTDLPATDPAVVVRVITTRPSPEGPVAVRQAWLEVPLCDGAVAFISADGVSLPNPGEALTAAQQDALDRWTQQLQNGAPPCVRACLEAAAAMHQRLPAIDQLAWDWIPASPEPLLLEGNGGFGLLVPQLFARLNATALQP